MLESFADLPAVWHWLTGGLIGLLVGSFLNVVIYRYPARLKYEWTAQSHEWIHKAEYQGEKPPGIVFPASHCSHCKAAINAWHNIPVVSYVWLKGRCSHCNRAFSWRYPFVEGLTACLTAFVIYHFGLSLAGACAVFLTWVLIALSFIDLDHQLLPDDIVLPTLWLGLAASLLSVFALPQEALLGAMAGYLVLWTVVQIFNLVTGKEGMGHGDFKLLALFGAWLGWSMLPQIILISTVLGSVVGLILIAFGKSRTSSAIPFGPFIAAAGWVAMLYGHQINQTYLRYMGI